jgi:hypothetical protein
MLNTRPVTSQDSCIRLRFTFYDPKPHHQAISATGYFEHATKLLRRAIAAQRRRPYLVVGAKGPARRRRFIAGRRLPGDRLGSRGGARLGGGTDEIQLNVIGEKALGLPSEPSLDKDVPYHYLKVGTSAEALTRPQSRPR